MFLTGCAETRPSATLNVCPEFPVPPPAMADELAQIPSEGYELFWAWMSDIRKLAAKLDACHASSV